jgi:protein PhnA
MDADRTVLLCDTCLPAITAGETLDASHWYCLQESVWSEVTAVQVLSFRLLHRTGGQSWATELLDQVYLEDDVRAWAESGLQGGGDAGEEPVDSNGTVLSEGDSVTLIKDLDVKGTGFTAKRGTLVKNIHLGDDPTHIEGRVNKTAIMLKTCFLKRVS